MPMVPRADGEFGRSYPCHPSFLATARRDLQGFLRGRGIAPGDLADIDLALGEVLVWIVQRQRTRVPGFSVNAVHSSDAVELRIEGGDYRFGARDVWDPEDELFAPEGFGILIVRKLMTTVEIRADRRQIRLVKRFHPG